MSDEVLALYVGKHGDDANSGRTQSKVSDIYTVAARTISGTGDIVATLGFYDLT